MLKSMTAYARAVKNTPYGQWTLEMHSTNRKFLDLSIHLPKEFLRFDIDIRKWVTEYLVRGHVSLRFTLPICLKKEAIDLTSLHVFKDLKYYFEKLAESLGYESKKEVDFQFLLSQTSHLLPSFVSSEDSHIFDFLKELCIEALKGFMEMKKQEGRALAEDIEHRLNLMVSSVNKIADRGGAQAAHYREKLIEKLSQVVELDKETSDRITREVVLYTDRLDITEELTRLRSHLSQFQKLMNSKEKSIGKTMDFLSQELGREINTIGSKSADQEVIDHVLLMKSELEKIKEQLQNIE